MLSPKTRTGRSAASFVCTSANITLAQPVLPAIDSKTFTDYGPLLSPSQVRTVPLSPDSVKRWAHFHRDGSLGAWSCLCDIIAQMFDKVNLTPVPKWVWERNCKNIFYFQDTLVIQAINGHHSSLHIKMHSKTRFVPLGRNFFKFLLLLYKEACKNAFSITFTICLQKIHKWTYFSSFYL